MILVGIDDLDEAVPESSNDTSEQPTSTEEFIGG
jgi:hypothetical protein